MMYHYIDGVLLPSQSEEINNAIVGGASATIARSQTTTGEEVVDNTVHVASGVITHTPRGRAGDTATLQVIT